MPKEYHVYRLFCQGKDKEGKHQNNIDELNALLKNGWVPIRETPAGIGSWNILAWCVVLEREVAERPKELKREPTLVESLQNVLDRLKRDQGVDMELAEADFLEELKKMN